MPKVGWGAPASVHVQVVAALTRESLPAYSKLQQLVTHPDQIDMRWAPFPPPGL